MATTARQQSHPQQTEAAQQQRPQSKDAATLQKSIAATEARMVTYKPFMATEEIKLNAAIVLKYFAQPTKTGKICSTTQAEKFVMLCKTRGLNPWEGDAYIVGYDTKDGPVFNLITAHQAFLKRAEANQHYDGMESGVIVKNKANGQIREVEGDFFEDGEILLGGWAKVYRKDQKHPTYRRLKLTAFRKNFGVWMDNPEGMICKCAESDSLRSAFPLSTAGMSFAEMVSRNTVEDEIPDNTTRAKIYTAPVQPDAETEDTTTDQAEQEQLRADTIADITARIGKSENADLAQELGIVGAEIVQLVGEDGMRAIANAIDRRLDELKGGE